MVGAAVVRRLAAAGCEILTVGREEVDLTRQADVERWLDRARPDAIVMAAARVGGIHANSTLPADFLFINLMIGANVVNAAHKAGVKRLVNLGSSCMYPVGAPQPIARIELGDGPARADQRGLRRGQARHRESLAADLPQAVRRRLHHGDPDQPLRPGRQLRPDDEPRRAGDDAAHDRGARQPRAPKVEIWGTGEPRRELMFVDDAADAIAFVLERYSAVEPINIGIGVDVSIRELAGLVAKTVGYPGELVFDTTSPMARRAGCSTTAASQRSAGVAVRRLPMGWTPCIAGTANTRSM